MGTRKRREPSEGALARIRVDGGKGLSEGSSKILNAELIERLVFEDLIEHVLCPLFVRRRKSGMPLKSMSKNGHAPRCNDALLGKGH